MNLPTFCLAQNCSLIQKKRAGQLVCQRSQQKLYLDRTASNCTSKSRPGQVVAIQDPITKEWKNRG